MSFLHRLRPRIRTCLLRGRRYVLCGVVIRVYWTSKLFVALRRCQSIKILINLLYSMYFNDLFLCEQAYFAKYDAVSLYLSRRKYPPGLTYVEKNTFRRFCKKFAIKGLYKTIHIELNVRLKLLISSIHSGTRGCRWTLLCIKESQFKNIGNQCTHVTILWNSWKQFIELCVTFVTSQLALCFPRRWAPHGERRPGPFGSEEQAASWIGSGGLSQRAEPPWRQQVSETAQRKVGCDLHRHR